MTLPLILSTDIITISPEDPIYDKLEREDLLDNKLKHTKEAPKKVIFSLFYDSTSKASSTLTVSNTMLSLASMS
jgi:hypothetical protein